MCILFSLQYTLLMPSLKGINQILIPNFCILRSDHIIPSPPTTTEYSCYFGSSFLQLSHASLQSFTYFDLFYFHSFPFSLHSHFYTSNFKRAYVFKIVNCQRELSPMARRPRGYYYTCSSPLSAPIIIIQTTVVAST
jgi:hypothetical protein